MPFESETTALLEGKSGHGIVGKCRSPSRKEEAAASPPHPRRSTAGTTAALSLAMLVQSFLLVGVFPYSGFLAVHLVPSLDEESAGRCAGLIASSFMAGRTLTSFAWGKAADRHGRKFGIEASLLLSAALSVLFGLAPTLPLALASRFALGLSNGIIGSIKTIISEMARGDKSKETRTMAVVMGMWGYGFLFNPALSGYLSDPLKQYPGSKFVELLDSFLNLTANPFLLPNLAGCLFCLSAYFCVSAFVEETLPKDKIEPFQFPVPSFCKRAAPDIVRTVSSWGLFKHLHLAEAETEANEEVDHRAGVRGITQLKGSDGGRCRDGDVLPRWVSPSPSTTALTILSPRSSAAKAKQVSKTIHDGVQVSHNEERGKDEEEEAATIRSLWRRPSTRKHLSLYWMYSFLVITVDETFPLYCMSKRSGLGIEEKAIGNLLSGTGFFYILIQFLLLTGLVDRYGFYKSMEIGALFSTPLVCLIPLSLFTNRGAAEGTLAWSTLAFVGVVYAIARACSSVTFSTLTMTTNRTVPAHQRAAMNGLSMLGGSLAKATGPAFAGLLFSESIGRVTPPLGSVLVWVVIACMGLVFFVQTLLLPEHVHNGQKVAQATESENTLQLATEGKSRFVQVSKKHPISMEDESEDAPPSF